MSPPVPESLPGASHAHFMPHMPLPTCACHSPSLSSSGESSKSGRRPSDISSSGEEGGKAATQNPGPASTKQPQNEEEEDPPAEALCNEIDQIWTSFTAFVPAEQQKKVVKWKHTKQDMSKVLAIIETEPKPDGLQDIEDQLILHFEQLHINELDGVVATDLMEQEFNSLPTDFLKHVKTTRRKSAALESQLDQPAKHEVDAELKEDIEDKVDGAFAEDDDRLCLDKENILKMLQEETDYLKIPLDYLSFYFITGILQSIVDSHKMDMQQDSDGNHKCEHAGCNFTAKVKSKFTRHQVIMHNPWKNLKVQVEEGRGSHNQRQQSYCPTCPDQCALLLPLSISTNYLIT
ncbi:hypothetical protein FIBSPDRAFT_951499 [Athelia psychrophila]|uniref:Uncharacterized protein n=1 Tax=Athelia psychrophila TaxID=1759441 RepID=A0A166MDL7_9AGAM|nr:hypothetical protein FIBSPDRAFT_951499 [Fibularhizoctonia sp. CBS 109695]